jgi:heat-inducible transcriptional repressor
MSRIGQNELSPRARQILYAAVTEFVETGQPVGSRTLSKKAGLDLSPASIRNVLADLEEAGYLMQPHASAGRTPTDKAFRFFIDSLMERRALSPDDAARIRTGFELIEPGGDVMRQTGRLLSELTGTAAVVVPPRVESLSLKHMRFIRTNPDELLAVLVMSNGSVQNRFLRGRASEADLQRIHNVMDDVTEGRTLGELRDLFARRLASERVQHDELRLQAFQLGEAAVADAPSHAADVVIEGQAKLLEQPEFADAAGVKQVVTALDERERLVELLDATIAATGTTVVVGSEAGELGGGQLSIVGATYTDHGRNAGTVGVIGPTRMDYPKVVPLVAATAHAMSAFIERSSERDVSRHEDDDE